MSKPIKRWRLKVPGTKPRLTIEERANRKGLYLHWWDGKSRRRPRLKGLDGVRGDDGSIDADLEAKAQRLGLYQYRKALAAGGRGGSVAAEASASNQAPTEPLNLRLGIDWYLAVPGGRYPGKTQQWHASRKARDRLLEILGEDREWESLRRGDISAVWRTFARRYEEWELGWRMAEQTVSALLACGRWLYDEDLIDSFTGPPSRWKEMLKEDWMEITGLTHLPSPQRLRYAVDELRALWMHLPEADPRLRLALQLAMEYRSGQAVRGERLDLDLTLGAGTGNGTFHIHGKGKKRGELVYLTPTQREAVDQALGPDGYLGDLEAQHRAGEIANYPLWPGGKLVKGKAKLNSSLMSRRSLLGHFYDLEKAAGVDHVDGRGLYGLRRLASDLTSRETTDERVRDAAGGWTSGSGTRARIYMEEIGNDPEVLSETASARARTRALIGSREEAPAAATVGSQRDPAADVQEALKRLGYSEDQRALILSIQPDQTGETSEPALLGARSVSASDHEPKRSGRLSLLE